MRNKLLQILSDGRFHSGEELGTELGISRTAVWKHIKSLKKYGLDIHAITGKGYCIARPVKLLSREQIFNSLAPGTRTLLSHLEILECVDSTNTYLLEKAATGASSGHVCVAEQQSAGRGRRGRKWISPFARNIYLSILWRFSMGPDALSGLGLAVGVAVLRALKQEGLNNGGLKWPNDVVWNQAKLAGILLEMTGQSSDNSVVVIGIGLNTNMHPGAGELIDQPWTSLANALNRPVSRNKVCALLIHHILLALNEFDTRGLQAFIDEWCEHDVLQGKYATFDTPGEMYDGVVRGIDQTGALMVENDGHIKRFLSGEVGIQSISDTRVV